MDGARAWLMNIDGINMWQIGKSSDHLQHFADAIDNIYDVVHELVPVHCFDLQFAIAEHALLRVPFLAPQAVIVPTGDHGYRVVELMPVGTLNLGDHQFVQFFEFLRSFVQAL